MQVNYFSHIPNYSVNNLINYSVDSLSNLAVAAKESTVDTAISCAEKALFQGAMLLEGVPTGVADVVSTVFTEYINDGAFSGETLSDDLKFTAKSLTKAVVGTAFTSLFSMLNAGTEIEDQDFSDMAMEYGGQFVMYKIGETVGAQLFDKLMTNHKLEE